MEGVTQEAASIAGHLGLGRLVYVYDDNHITIDGTTALSFTTEDKGKRFEAYGWHVQHVDDSDDLDALLGALAAAKAEEERPSLIVLRSHIAYPGAACRRHRQGARRPARGRPRCARRRRRWASIRTLTFAVSDAVREHMAVVRERGAEQQREWEERLAGRGRTRSPTWRASASSTSPASRARAGARRSPSSPRARTWRRATPAAR